MARDLEFIEQHAKPERDHPMFPTQLRAATVEALSILLMRLEMQEDVAESDLAPLNGRVSDMADALFPDVEGVLDLADHGLLKSMHHVHPVKVAEVSMLMLRLAGARRANLRQIGIAALLMNLGYRGMRSTALEQEGALSPADEAELRQHPAHGTAMLAGSGLHPDLLAAIAQHHERWDGSGYPAGLREREATPYARIIGVADTFVTLSSRRYHREAMPPAAVRSLLSDDAGTLFDPHVVRIAVEELPRWIAPPR